MWHSLCAFCQCPGQSFLSLISHVLTSLLKPSSNFSSSVIGECEDSRCAQKQLPEEQLIKLESIYISIVENIFSHHKSNTCVHQLGVYYCKQHNTNLGNLSKKKTLSEICQSSSQNKKNNNNKNKLKI